MSVSALASHIDSVALIDHHVHGCWLRAGDRHRFENGLNEANVEPLADFDSAFDTQIGFAVRAHCAPLLGLPRYADADAYWNRRSEVTECELARLFLSEAKVSDWLVDTGFASGVADLDALADLSVGRVHEIVRLESVAQEAIEASDDYATAFARLLHERAKTAIATKSILAYRGGFDGDLSAPSPAEVAAAAQRWRDRGGTRLTDRVLLRFGLHEALRLTMPLQFHVGFGDRDCDLHSTNPLYLLDFLRVSGDTPIMLLHCYPFHREAGFLASVYPHVFLDVGLAANYVGGAATAVVSESMELAPFGKILYSSDAYGPAELVYTGAMQWRHATVAVLDQYLKQHGWPLDECVRIATMIGRTNAESVYRLTDGELP